MTINKETIALLWKIKPRNMAGVQFAEPSVKDLEADGDSSTLSIRRRIIHLSDGSAIFLLRTAKGDHILSDEAFVDRDKWNQAFKPLLQKVQRLEEEKRKKAEAEYLKAIRRGEPEDLSQDTPQGTIRVTAIVDGSPISNWKRWDDERVYVTASCGEPIPIRRQFITKEINTLARTRILPQMTERDLQHTTAPWDYDCDKCKRRHKVSIFLEMKLRSLSTRPPLK